MCERLRAPSPVRRDLQDRRPDRPRCVNSSVLAKAPVAARDLRVERHARQVAVARERIGSKRERHQRGLAAARRARPNCSAMR